MEKEEPDKSSAEVANETGDSVTPSERRSQREKKNKRTFSPVLEEDTKKKRKKLPRPFSYTSSSRPCDLLPNGEPFCCKLCKSPYVTNPYAKGVRKAKRSRHVPLPKKRLDSIGREILVCNACCQILDRQIRPKKPNKELTAEERNKYLEDAKTFAKSLAETLSEPEAEKLYCPVSVYKICGCLQKYIKGKDTDETALELRVTELLDLMKEAVQLREQKVYIIPENLGTSKYSRRRLKYIGYGNGHKKSKEFEEFVLDKRRVLKEDMRLCERATQRILLYSNNFLHKKLKTEERPCRITRTKGKAALGKLHDIDSLHKQTCCIDGCVRLSLTHPNLLKSWRSRAVSGQMEARKVIAEMLTPAGGYRLNCYQFVSMVTGCALTTIGKVNNQLRETGGRQDPPEHGMKRLWTNGQRNRTDTVSSGYGPDSHIGELPVAQTQSVTGLEVTSEVLRPSQNQSGSTSTNLQAFPTLPQGEVMRIKELIKKKHELQQQQQIVQYQIQQTLGQHSGLPQNTGWITPQLIGQFPNTIGSSNSSFVPVGNISQTEFPQYIPPISNFTLGQTNPSQLQSSTSQNMLVSKLNVPVVGQVGPGYSQIPTVTNQFLFNSNQVTSVYSEANLGSAPFQPVKSLSVGSSNTVQPVIEVVNLDQVQTEGEESNSGANKTQPQIDRQLVADYDNSVPSDAQQPHVLNSSVPNPTQFSHLNQNHFIPNLSPTITNHFDHGTAASQPVLKQVLIGTDSSPSFPEFIHQPLLLSPIDPILQQIQSDKDVSFISEDNYNSQGAFNINDLGKDVTLAFVDQNGVKHQFTFPNSAVEIESQLFSVNNKPAAVAGDLNPGYQVLNPAEQQISVQEQFNDQSSEDLAAYLSGDVHISRLNVGNLSVSKSGTHLGETSGSHGYDKQSRAQIRGENNKETSAENTKETLDNFPVSLRLLSAAKENQTVQNSNLSSKVPKKLEKVGLTMPAAEKLDRDMTDLALPTTHRIFPDVVDKSTNTCAEQINDQYSCELNTNETVAYRESINDMNSSCESDTNANLIDHKKSRNAAKQDRGSIEKTRASRKVLYIAFGRKSPGDYSSEGSNDNMNSKLDGNQTVDKCQEGKKQDRNHRSRHSSKGFQKLQSKNGKVFLHSNTQRRALEKHDKETQDTSTYSDVEKLHLPNNESGKEKTFAKCVPITQASVKGTSNSYSSQTKTLQVSERVKDKLRKSLNIPILPKTMKPAQPDLRIPVELQPFDSSLFVVPQSSQNITSLKHMTKSKVQVQQPVSVLRVETAIAAASPPVNSADISIIDQPVSQSVDQIHKPAFTNSLVDGQQIHFTDVANSNISEMNLLAGSQNLRVAQDRNLSERDAMYISEANVLKKGEVNALQTSTSIKEKQKLPGASETGLTPDIRNINIDGSTSPSTNIMTIGNLPPVFLQSIHIASPPVPSIAYPSNLNSPKKDHSLTVVKKIDGQSVLTLPFDHSLKAPQEPTASPKSRKQRFPNKTRKSGSAARPHTPPIPVILSANLKCPEIPENRDHSPAQLVELSSDAIQQGVQNELNLLQEHPD